MIKNKTQQELINEVIELGYEIESIYYNNKFGLYNSQKVYQARVKAHRRLEFIKDIENVLETNEDFNYAMQFI